MAVFWSCWWEVDNEKNKSTLWLNQFQKLQKEEIGFTWKPTLEGNKKTNVFYKLNRDKTAVQQSLKVIV